MNSITKFFHELFTPHCQHCVDERREQREEKRFCASCESLARENDRLVRDNERLMNLILEKPKVVEEKIQDVRDLKPVSTTRVPFIPSAVKRQLMEKESRHAAELLRNAPKPDSQIDVVKEAEELEVELNRVRQERESTTKVG